MTRRRTALIALLVVALFAAGCSYRTTGGITGDRTFRATFPDVQHLVVGHTVRLADVPVGTVTDVRLDGYQAVVKLSVEDGRDFPAGTTASISATSLLGENYVRLTLPDDPGTELLQDGDELRTTGADASFEELTGELLAVLRAVNGRDLATIVDNTAQAIGGRGPELNQLVRTVGEVTDGLVSQSEDLVAILDSLAAAGEVLVDDADLIAESIDRAAEATAVVARERDRIVDAVDGLTDAAQTLDDEVLTPHRERLDRILDRLQPITRTLADNRATVAELLDSLRVANALVPRVVDRDEAVIYGMFDVFILPAGLGGISLSEILPLSGSEAVTALLDPAPGGPS